MLWGGSDWVGFFPPSPSLKCILIPSVYILISLGRKKKKLVSLKNRHSVLQNAAASLAEREAGWHYPLV